MDDVVLAIVAFGDLLELDGCHKLNLNPENDRAKFVNE
jgi:hypothetical protein